MRYLYYRLWQLFTKIKTNDMPATNAMIFLSTCQFANIFIIYIILKHFSLININLSTKIEVYSFTVPIGLLLYTVNYFYLYKNRDKLHNKYKNDSKKQNIFGNILLIMYIVGSIVLVFI